MVPDYSITRQISARSTSILHRSVQQGIALDLGEAPRQSVIFWGHRGRFGHVLHALDLRPSEANFLTSLRIQSSKTVQKKVKQRLKKYVRFTVNIAMEDSRTVSE